LSISAIATDRLLAYLLRTSGDWLGLPTVAFVLAAQEVDSSDVLS
jgi:hypothetical protein